MENIAWTEKYRPRTVASCILPERLKKPFQTYVDKGYVPTMLLSGGPGVGKTTIAMAMCEELGCDYMIINGSDENGVDMVRDKIKTYASSMSLAGGRKVIIIDEADYLSPNAQAAFRNAMETFESNCSFVFTCNFKAKLMDAIHSRNPIIEFNLKNEEKTQMASQFFKRVLDILRKENVSFEEKVVAAFVKKHFPDFRHTLLELQHHAILGKIDLSILSQGDVVLSDVINFLKEKDFKSLRKWIVTSEIDPATLYRKIYDGMVDNLQPQSIPQAVIILADYQYKQAFVADSEINMVACLTELLVNCEFKK